MLWLKRNTHWNDLLKCDVSDEFIGPGDFYYEDDEDGAKIKATVYQDIKRKQTEETWDYAKINSAANQLEYKEMVKAATRQMLCDTILERKVAKPNNLIFDS